MNRGVLAFDSGGRIRVSTSALADHFNGGTPTSNTGELAVRTTAPVRWLAGLGYDAAGCLCVADGGTPTSYVGGLGVTAAGALCVSGSNAVARAVSGLPVDSLGRLCVVGLADGASIAADWQARVITNGGTVSAGTLTAVTNFVNQAMAAGYWSKLTRINLICGTGLAAARTPLVVGGGSAMEALTNIVAGDYVETGATGGLKGDKATKYFNTGWDPVARGASLTDFGLFAYVKGLGGAGVSEVTIGILQPAGANTMLGWISAGTKEAGVVASSVYAPAGASPSVEGLTGVSCSVGRNQQFYANGTPLGAPVVSDNAFATVPFFGLALNSNATAASWSNRYLRGYAITKALTDAEVAAFHVHMQLFQIALQRSTIDDPVVGDWYNRVFNNGGTVKAATAQAVNTFVKAAKANGYWSKIERINLYAGDQLAACLTPLKIGSGTATDVPAAFVEADYAENVGLKGNTTSKWLNTGVPGNFTTQDNRHLSVYERSRPSAVAKRDIGLESASSTDPWMLNAATLDSIRYISGATLVACDVAGLTGVAAGHVLGQNNLSVTNIQIYRNGVKISDLNTASAQSVVQTHAIGVHASNRGTGRIGYTDGILAGYSIGLTLTQAEITAYNTDMQAFQTALGRNV